MLQAPPRYPLRNSVPSEKSMARLGLRPHLPHRHGVSGGGRRHGGGSDLHPAHGVPSRTPEPLRGHLPQQRGHLLSGVTTHLLDLFSLFSLTFHCLYYLPPPPTKGKREKRKSLHHNSVSGSYHFQTPLSTPFQLSLLSREFSFIKIKPHFRLIFFSLSPFLQIERNVIAISLASCASPLAFITKPSSP